MLISTIGLLIGAICFLIILIVLLINFNLINWQSILIIIAIAILLAGLIWLAQLTDFFTNWNLFHDLIFKIKLETDNILF